MLTAGRAPPCARPPGALGRMTRECRRDDRTTEAVWWRRREREQGAWTADGGAAVRRRIGLALEVPRDVFAIVLRSAGRPGRPQFGVLPPVEVASLLADGRNLPA